MEEVKEEREENSSEKKKQRKMLGVFEESIVVNYDRAVFARRQVEKPTPLSYRSDPRTLPHPSFLA